MQLGSLGPPPPHMDPHIVASPNTHVSSDSTSLPPSALTPQTSSSPTNLKPGKIMSPSPSLSPSVPATHSNQYYRSSPSRASIADTDAIGGSLIPESCDNKSSINALQCLRPWTSPHLPHFAPISSTSTASTITTSNENTKDTSFDNIV